MSEFNKDEMTQDFIEFCERNRYMSSEYGYAPHAGQIRMICPRCRNGTFRCPPQSVPADAPVWCWEHVCASCGQTIGIEVVRG